MARAEKYQIAVPYNRAAVATVWKIAAGELKSGLTALQELEKMAQDSGPAPAPELIAPL